MREESILTYEMNEWQQKDQTPLLQLTHTQILPRHVCYTEHV